MFKMYFAQKFSDWNIRPAVASKYLKTPSRKTNCPALSWTTLIKTQKRLGCVGTCVKATFRYGSECVSRNMLQALCPYLSVLAVQFYESAFFLKNIIYCYENTCYLFSILDRQNMTSAT